MSNTLVIHPSDWSTDFLSLIYEDKDYDVISDCTISDHDLRAAIEAHDRIIMMGHGCNLGLFNPRKGGLIINDSHADLLRTKETVSIWCFSDQFFRRHNIPGFHTGMIISEVSEEFYMLGYAPLDEDDILSNMEHFASIINDCIDSSPEFMKKYILSRYNDDDPVTEFNRENIIII